MSSDLEDLSNGVFDNYIPEVWSKASYSSLKPLSSYITDFVARMNFMESWIEAPPASFWISGFYFT